MEPITVRLLGKSQILVFGKWMLPGETRELHPAQVQQLEAWYPQRFARVGAIEEMGVEPVSAAGYYRAETPAPVRAVTEAARKLAEANAIGLDAVTGTGAGGNVTKADVERALSELTAEDEPDDAPEDTDEGGGDVDQPE